MHTSTDPLAHFWARQTDHRLDRRRTGRINCGSRLRRSHPVSEAIHDTLRQRDLSPPPLFNPGRR